MTTITKPKRKLIKIETIRLQLDVANEVLSSPVSQKIKASVCTAIEQLLFDCDMYSGYNNIYWLAIGCKDWNNSEQNNDNKMDYIIGVDGNLAKQNKDDSFVSDIQGEYSRYYFSKNLI